MRGATSRHDDQVIPLLSFLLTRPMRGATIPCLYLIFFESISTHTPLARRDNFSNGLANCTTDFYSHASCEARQKIIEPPAGEDYISTHTPLARRDICKRHWIRDDPNFYSHASCEARPWLVLCWYI